MNKLENFQKELEPITEALIKLIKKYNINNGVTITLIDGKVIPAINVDEFR
jgi:hypothetical protein